MSGPPWAYSYDIGGPVDGADFTSGTWLDDASEKFGRDLHISNLRSADRAFAEASDGLTAEAFLHSSRILGNGRGQDLIDRAHPNARDAWRAYLGFRSILKGDLRGRLMFGSLVAAGDPERPGQDPVWIPIRSWFYLKLNDDGLNSASGKAGDYFYVKVFDLHTLRSQRDDSLPMASPTTFDTPDLDAVEQWFKDRVRLWPAGKPAPTEKQDVAAAQSHFGDYLKRETVRSVRREVTPEAWQKRGPRGPKPKGKTGR